MGNILILYDSKTGHTRKMAQIIAQGAEAIPGMNVRLKPVAEASQEDVLWCDGLAVGSPTHLGLMSWRMKRFWDDTITPELWGKIDGKIACAFSSSGGWGGGNELTCLNLLILLMNFGFFVFGLPDYVGDKFTLHYGAVTAGEPRREVEIAACERLGKRLAQWVGFYVDGRAELHPGPVNQR